MTALATNPDGSSLAAGLRAHAAVAFLALAMLALWIGAGWSLAVNGSGEGFDTPAARATPVAQTRLKQVAATMSATRLKQIAPTDAVALNAAIPVSDADNPAARPFLLRAGAEHRERSIDCLAAAIYYEAATEPADGQRAVAQVVLNRVRHPAYPSTVCGVVFEGAYRVTGCQFSFSCDGSLRRSPIPALWRQARQIATAALDGYVYGPVGWATHYHANYVVPYWASSLVKSKVVGNHIFYRWRGGWGRAPAFVNRHPGAEPAIAWRGGFGQPGAAERLAGEAAIRDAAAAEAAEGVPPIGTVDSFQRAVLRRYEPIERESARAMISERTRADQNLTQAQRWALTGKDEEAETPQQRPLGRWGVAPPERSDSPPPPATAPTPNPPARSAAASPAAAGPGGGAVDPAAR